jgi:hypothetical protein
MDSLKTTQVWDGIVTLGLLEDHMTHGTLILGLKQTDSKSNAHPNHKNDAVCHTCNKCMRIYDFESGESQGYRFWYVKTLCDHI